MKHNEFKVYNKQGRYIDTVFFIQSMLPFEVKESLINHDNFAPDIHLIPNKNNKYIKIMGNK